MPSLIKRMLLNEPFIYLTNEQHKHNLSLSQIQPILILWNGPSTGDFDSLRAKDSVFYGFDVLTLPLIIPLAVNQTHKSLRNILLNC